MALVVLSAAGKLIVHAAGLSSHRVKTRPLIMIYREGRYKYVQSRRIRTALCYQFTHPHHPSGTNKIYTI